MKAILSVREIEIPIGIKLILKARNVIISGPKGTIKKSFKHSLFEAKFDSKIRKLRVRMWLANKKSSSKLNTISSHILNMIFGVSYGFEYKMKFVYAHFPINFSTINEGKIIEIRNFLGERRVRKVLMGEGVICKKLEEVKDEISVSGIDLSLVSLSAALIQQSCLIRNKDIRKFLDGIYVSSKGKLY